jgi:hypothetical protein
MSVAIVCMVNNTALKTNESEDVSSMLKKSNIDDATCLFQAKNGTIVRLF